MGSGRGKHQGLINILRFNYPMYIGTALVIAIAGVALAFTEGWLRLIIGLGMGAAALQVLVSLAASSYAYDRSGLYELTFLPETLPGGSRILNLSAGFDECSGLIAARYPDASVAAYDFFDERRHTEPSIRRARAVYPSAPGTRIVTTDALPDSDHSVALVCLMLSAHEIRSAAERHIFLREIRRVLTPDGRVFVVEHLRDAANAAAYSIGALHFHAARTWRQDFSAAGLRLVSADPLNGFIYCFTLSPADDLPA